MSQQALFIPDAVDLRPTANRCVICPSRADGPVLDVVDVDPDNWTGAAVSMRNRRDLPVDLFEVSPEGAWTLRDRMPHPTKAQRAALARAWDLRWPKIADTVRRIAGPLDGDVQLLGEALHSPCGRYRYAVARWWDTAAAPLVVIGLNPSIADASQSDPTLTRVCVRARMWGYGGVVIGNLFALISTDPAGLREAEGGPVGLRNDTVLEHFARAGYPVLAAWGAHGGLDGRDAIVKRKLREWGAELYVLALTKGGHPGHPLYLPYRLPLQRWAP